MNILRRIMGAEISVTLALVSGCGGNVNLGEKSSPGPGTVADGGAANVAEVPNAARSEPVAKLAESFSIGTLAVAGEYLYFGGLDSKEAAALFRCNKSDCDPTRERLPNVSGFVSSLQTFGQRLGVANLERGIYWLGSYALPDGSDKQIALGDLPPSSSFAPLFHDGFVFFSVDLEYSAYRCALPDCSDTLKRIGSTLNLPFVNFRAAGELVFWTDGQFVYRAGAYGDEPPRTLLADATLSEAPPQSTTGEMPTSDGVVSLATDDVWLYAAVTHSETGKACDSFCPHRVERWPLAGGSREVLFDTEEVARKLFVFDGELAWLGPSLRDPQNLDAARLSTCRVEACAATTRNLGEVRSVLDALVADDTDLYWLEAEPAVSPGLQRVMDRQIRRAARLPPP